MKKQETSIVTPVCSVWSTGEKKNKRGTLEVCMKKTFSSFPRKRNLSLSVREGTKSDPSGDEESCEISCHRPRIVSPGCMLVLSDDDES